MPAASRSRESGLCSYHSVHSKRAGSRRNAISRAFRLCALVFPASITGRNRMRILFMCDWPVNLPPEDLAIFDNECRNPENYRSSQYIK